jgi:predicted TIM-barrel fold metal-dependent hydrolase
MVQVIDYWCNLFTEAGLQRFRESQMLRYAFELFHRQERIAKGAGRSAEAFLEELDEAGVERILIPAFKMGDPWGDMEMDQPEEEILELTKRSPKRIYGLVGINPKTRMEGVQRLEHFVKEHSFVGAHLHPYGFGLPPNHRRYYPFYAKCVELSVPVVMQIGHSAEFMPNELGRPLYLDDVALDFPELKIVAAHTGWPWCEELIALAWKHPNVFIGTSAHAPKYLGTPGYGTLLSFMNTRGKEKVLFGTDYPVLYHKEALEQVKGLGLSEEAERSYLRENALRVFKLE